MRKQLFKNQFLLYALLISVLLAACSPVPAKPPLNTNPGPTTTVCPAAGNARPAVIPPIQLGNRPELIYYSGDDQNNGSSLKRINISTRVTTEIVNEANANITEAQVSPDGQWILFLVRINNPHEHVELRLVRVDGQYQQTLFCMPASSSLYSTELGQFVWSPDLASVAIAGFSGQFNLPAVYIVDLSQGKAQLVLASSYSQLQKGPNGSYPQEIEIYTPLKWLDNMHLYIGGYKAHTRDYASYQYNLYLLDTTKGANQHNAELQTIFTSTRTNPNSGASICDFDSSGDGTQLFVAQCTYKDGNVQQQGSITVQTATGGPSKTIFSTRSFAIIGVRVINPQTLLLLTDTSIGNGYSGDNLWKINSDGSGLTHLASGHALTWCSYLQSACTNVSLDGSMYAYMAYGGASDLVYYGSLTGGQPRQVVQLSSLYQSIVGWTTL